MDVVIRNGDEKKRVPPSLVCGFFVFVLFGCLAALFGHAIAERISNGVATFYASATLCGGLLYIICKRKRIMPFGGAPILMALTVIGFALVVAARLIANDVGNDAVDDATLLACVPLGAGLVICCLNPFLGLSVARRHSSRLIVPAIVAIALLAVWIHLLLLGQFANRPSTLYAIYLFIIVAMGMSHFLMWPYWVESLNPSASPDTSATASDLPATASDLPALASDLPALASSSPTSAEAEDATLHTTTSPPAGNLTSRELQVARELMRGYNYKQIAARLYISPSTVATHRKKIYSKLNVHNVPELMARMESSLAEEDGRDNGGRQEEETT